MDKFINILLELSSLKEQVSIPVRYSIEEENRAVIVYNCKIDLPDDKIPAWLKPEKFTIRRISRNSVTSSGFKPQVLWKSIDGALFADATMQHIRIREAQYNK